jgi:hypothetical protein
MGSFLIPHSSLNHYEEEVGVKSFTSKFKFDSQKHLFVGTEREAFITRNNAIVPIAPELLTKFGLGVNNNYGYELSACQLEMRTCPVLIQSLYDTLTTAGYLLADKEKMFNFKLLHDEVAPYDMPLDIYPNDRYRAITQNMPVETLRAACRVAGTHIHIGMGSPELAIKTYNAVVEQLHYLCKIGDKSNGERLRIYKIMAPDFHPPHYDSWESYERYAKEHDFAESPRNCWHLIRISIHGTIEFRMFGATPSIVEIVQWAAYCHALCKNAV